MVATLHLHVGITVVHFIKKMTFVFNLGCDQGTFLVFNLELLLIKPTAETRLVEGTLKGRK